MTRRWFAALVSLFALGTAAHADITRFYGNWENQTHDISGIRHVIISPAGGNRVNVRVYGDCHPGECDWGMVPADSQTSGFWSRDVVGLSATIHFGFAHRKITLKQSPDGSLRFEAAYEYVPSAGRHNLAVAGQLRHTDWAGPMSKASWEQPAGRDVGWGGGPRGNPLKKPELKCNGFNPAAVTLVKAGPGFNLVADGVFLIHTDWNEKTARQAVEVIKHYRFDHKCHTGTAEFWTSNSAFPVGKMTGASCMQFNSTTVHTVSRGNSWRLVDGPMEIFNAKTSKDNATAVVAMIRRSKLVNKCVVGWPNPVITYWLSK